MDGSLRRLTFGILVLLLSPGVLAATPVTNLPAAFSLGGQEVADVAMDPSGEYVVGVVPVDPASLVSGITPGQVRHDDVYPCHFGPPASVSSGFGCRNPGLQHTATRRTTQLSAKQAVDYTSFQSGGLVARYAIAGPSDTLSLWSSNEDLPRWEVQVPGNQAVNNVTLAPDARRVLAGTTSAGGSGAGRILMYNSTSPTTPQLLWELNLTTTRPTSMDYARSGQVAVVGASPVAATNNGEVLIFPPRDAVPVNGASMDRISVGNSNVNHVIVTPDGRAAIVGTSQYVFFFGIDPLIGREIQTLRWSLQIPGGCQRVAVTHDNLTFAAACGTKVYFFRHLTDSTLLAQSLGSFDTGAPVADLAYDARGSILVAVAGNVVYGFGPDKTTPIWQFTATDAANGGLDGPLRRVLVSDGGERIVVAGHSRIMPYRTVFGATGVFVQPQRMEVQPATTARLSLTVTNKGSVTDNYTFSARFPPGWSGFSPGPVRLDPEQSATVNLTLDVPVGQAPGFFGVEVDIRSEALQKLGRSQVIVASPSLNLTVPRAVVLNVTTSDDRVPSLRPGGEVTVPVTIRNRGNADGLVNLSTTQILTRGAPWILRFQTEQITLRAGGEQTVPLVIAAPQDAASGDRNDITICARESDQRTCVKDASVLYEATKTITAYVDPRFGAELSTNVTPPSFEFGPGELRILSVTILNNGNTDDDYNLTALISPAGVQNDWRVTLERESIKIPRGEKRTVTVTVRAAVTEPRDASLIVRAISVGSSLTEDGSLTISLVPRPPTSPTDDKFIPMPGALAVAGLAALAATWRRRGGS